MRNKPKLKKGNFWFILIPLLASLVVFVIGNRLIKLHTSCANSLTCKTDLTLKIDNNAIGIFEGHKVIPPKIYLAHDNIKPSILGANAPSGKKHIYINLATQTLYAYQGNKQIMKTVISSGKWGRTPVGNFNIWTKVRSTRMAGGSGDDAYDLPNVPHVMYFYNDFGVHGAYWHNNFGHEMSHGCINMRLIDAEDLYSWAEAPKANQKGTLVSICDEFTAPNLCIQKGPIN
ncbi:MAG: L,D-transpeptidase [bacterium]